MEIKNLVSYVVGIICFASLALTTLAHADDFYRLDEAIPVDGDTAKYAPVFDFDGDGCLPSAGISRHGEKNGGLKTTGSLGGDCRSSNFLETSNTLHRYACIPDNNSGSIYCGHFYSLYFEKDQCYDDAIWEDPFCGHRHDWEVVAVWTTDGVITHVCASAHGDCHPKEASSSSVLFEGNHVKIVYHKEEPFTHALRFAHSNEDAENPYDYFVTPTLASWYELEGDNLSNCEMRGRLDGFNYGSASIPLKDGDDAFLKNLNKYKPEHYPDFNLCSIEASNPNAPGFGVTVEICDGRDNDCDGLIDEGYGHDDDGDGWGSDCDNCPYTNNPSQEDIDDDGEGDACDPVADANGPYESECTSHEGADVELDGSGSFDPDGDLVAYEWLVGGQTVWDMTPTVLVPLGEYNVNLTVEDDDGYTDSDQATISVVDTQAPEIAGVTAEPDELWPPNHKMRDVVLYVDVEDICDSEPQCEIAEGGVFSNEPDWIITGDLTLRLRAERAGRGDGRVYTVDVICVDGSGNSTTGTTTISVPHKRK
jgi:Necrosis inducing protein (NPP1)/PKD domain